MKKVEVEEATMGKTPGADAGVEGQLPSSER